MIEMKFKQKTCWIFLVAGKLGLDFLDQLEPRIYSKLEKERVIIKKKTFKQFGLQIKNYQIMLHHF